MTLDRHVYYCTMGVNGIQIAQRSCQGEVNDVKVIDADGHVEESVAMFKFLDKDYFERRPLALGLDTDTIYGRNNAIWLIDGQTYPKMFGRGGVIFSTPTSMQVAKSKSVSIPAQELTDVQARIKDLDTLKIDKQVVYPTLFLSTTAEDVKLETAILQAYNSFMADACSKSGGRIKFAALMPIRDVNESVRELNRVKELGAASVMLLGIAWDRSLRDQGLYPFYEEAASLDIPICIHFGWGSPGLTASFEWCESFNSAALPVLMSFYSIMTSNVLDALPKLRFAFLEAGSQWLPYMIHQIRRSGRAKRDPAEYFREGRMYIGCETDEDINYLVELIGEYSLVGASDYPHTDPSQEEEMVESFMKREDLTLRIKEKILSVNPQNLYKI